MQTVNIRIDFTPPDSYPSIKSGLFLLSMLFVMYLNKAKVTVFKAKFLHAVGILQLKLGFLCL